MVLRARWGLSCWAIDEACEWVRRLCVAGLRIVPALHSLLRSCTPFDHLLAFVLTTDCIGLDAISMLRGHDRQRTAKNGRSVLPINP